MRRSGRRDVWRTRIPATRDSCNCRSESRSMPQIARTTSRNERLSSACKLLGRAPVARRPASRIEDVDAAPLRNARRRLVERDAGAGAAERLAKVFPAIEARANNVIVAAHLKEHRDGVVDR